MVEKLIDIKERKANECAITQTLQVISCSPKNKLSLPQDWQKLGHMLHIGLWDLVEVRRDWQVVKQFKIKPTHGTKVRRAQNIDEPACWQTNR